MPHKYAKFVDDDTFISHYLEMMNDSETASIFDFWAAIWCIGAVCGREVIVPRPLAKVRLNWYIILTGESGRPRKSTSISMANRVTEGLLPKHAVIAQGPATAGQFEYNLAVQSIHEGVSVGIISVSEFGRFMKSRGHTLLFTDLYDCPDLQQCPGSRDVDNYVLRNVFITLLCGTTPTALFTMVSPTVVSSGFTSRCIFPVANEGKRRNAWPEPVDENKKFEIVVNKLKQIHSTVDMLRAEGPIEIKVNEPAKKIFRAWYSQHATNTNDPFINSFDGREDDHVLRMAATLAINDGIYAITAKHIRNAIRLIREIKRCGVALFSSHSANASLIHAVEIVRNELIAHKQGVSHTNIYKKIQHLISPPQFRIMMMLMHEMKMVYKYVPSHTKQGRPSTIWQVGENFNHQGTISKFLVEIER